MQIVELEWNPAFTRPDVRLEIVETGWSPWSTLFH